MINATDEDKLDMEEIRCSTPNITIEREAVEELIVDPVSSNENVSLLIPVSDLDKFFQILKTQEEKSPVTKRNHLIHGTLFLVLFYALYAYNVPAFINTLFNCQYEDKSNCPMEK